MKLSELRALCAATLEKGGIERPRYVADILASSALGLDRATLVVKKDYEVPSRVCEGILSMVKMRMERVPLSYIIGEAEFYGHVFKVGRGCLIPRPETELLVEEMLKLCAGAGYFADWCTGSGCIGVSMLLENAELCGVGVDSSVDALKWADINRKLHGVEKRFELIRNAEPDKCAIGKNSLDFVIANPPYIPSGEIGLLMRDVREYEPKEALDGGESGVELYRALFASLPAFVKDGGCVGFEIGGDSQGRMLIDMAPPEFMLLNKVFDYNGILRHLIWRISQK